MPKLHHDLSSKIIFNDLLTGISVKYSKFWGYKKIENYFTNKQYYCSVFFLDHILLKTLLGLSNECEVFNFFKRSYPVSDVFAIS